MVGSDKLILFRGLLERRRICVDVACIVVFLHGVDFHDGLFVVIHVDGFCVLIGDFYADDVRDNFLKQGVSRMQVLCAREVLQTAAAVVLRCFQVFLECGNVAALVSIRNHAVFLGEVLLHNPARCFRQLFVGRNSVVLAVYSGAFPESLVNGFIQLFAILVVLEKSVELCKRFLSNVVYVRVCPATGEDDINIFLRVDKSLGFLGVVTSNEFHLDFEIVLLQQLVQLRVDFAKALRLVAESVPNQFRHGVAFSGVG